MTSPFERRAGLLSLLSVFLCASVFALVGCGGGTEPAKPAESPTSPLEKGAVKSFYKDYGSAKANTPPKRGRAK
jgi:hypothetical protein